MKILVVTEGTYPQSLGGVSVWCDQLIRGLPEFDFQVHAISATGNEQHAWQVPANVTVTHIPLWGASGPARGKRAGPASSRQAMGICEVFLRGLVDDPVVKTDIVVTAMRAMVDLSDAATIGQTLRGETAVRVLIDAWEQAARRDDRPPISVYDAIYALDILDHWIRPLLYPVLAADVTHAVSNGLASLVALNAKWRHGTAFLLTEHGVYLRERYLSFRSAGYSWPVKALLLGFLRQVCTAAYRAADVVTPGNRYNRRWERQGGTAGERIRTVYNGVDPECFPPAEGEPEVPTMSWAGRIDPIKDLETLIRAFAMVQAEIPDARLRIFGGTPKGNEGYRERCQALAGELGVAEAVRFEGRVEQIRDAYAAGHVVVLSSISEGFPYTLIEAMASGRATVSTDVGGVAEAVADTGLVVPPRDPAAMAQACMRLLRDDQTRRELAIRARERAVEYFTVEKTVDAFRDIYMDLSIMGACHNAVVAINCGKGVFVTYDNEPGDTSTYSGGLSDLGFGDDSEHLPEVLPPGGTAVGVARVPYQPPAPAPAAVGVARVPYQQPAPAPAPVPAPAAVGVARVPCQRPAPAAERIDRTPTAMATTCVPRPQGCLTETNSQGHLTEDNMTAIAQLIERMYPICVEAVDSLEIAAVLEAEGMTDAIAADQYGVSDVFQLADRLFQDTARDPASPKPVSELWQTHLSTHLLRGVLFAVPGVCYTTVSGFVGDATAVFVLLVSLILSWSFARVLAYLGYVRKGNSDDAGAMWILRQGLLWGSIAAIAPSVILAVAMRTSPAVAIIATAQVIYMMAATVLLVCGRERLLVAALIPGLLGAGLRLLPEVPLALSLTASASTVVMVTAAAVYTTWGKHSGSLSRAEIIESLPQGLFGLLTAGMLVFLPATVALVDTTSGETEHAAMLALPLTLSMGPAEWIMFRYRAATQGALMRTHSLRAFGRYAATAVGIVVVGYLAMLAAGLVITAWLWSVPWAVLASYLALGGAVFIALLLIASGVRAPVLVMCTAALVAECAAVAWHMSPQDAQLVSCAVVLVVLFMWAQVVLRRATRHHG